MANISKRMNLALEAASQDKLAIEAAVAQVQKISKEHGPKFKESMDIVVRLGVPVGASVRGSVCPEHGLGKDVKVAVFAKGEAALNAEKAGAEVVGEADLVEKFNKGEVDVDVVIATPDMMSVVGKLGRVLGPKGLMPNPKDGTVSADPARAVAQAKRGQIFFRTDKKGAVHARIGPVAFEAEKLVDNIKLLVAELKRLKPSTAKGQYLKSFYVNATMGPGIAVDTNTLD